MFDNGRSHMIRKNRIAIQLFHTFEYALLKLSFTFSLKAFSALKVFLLACTKRFQRPKVRMI